ncbi:CRISPR-associated protein Cas5 [Actinokineospora auranticolor]|uniref:CRISPR-associated protein Cas5 n=1 Tax=Actinokineospora auranticolor TaxID=155976 RepID=UPI000CEBA03F|nr:CRISPR-associated protein Cas5 [Actinokineospora auranticolor]
MSTQTRTALQVVITAPVVSFRNPLYRGVQVGLPCPPPATVGGLLAAAAGGWHRVSRDLRFAMAFHARGAGEDLETYHPLVASGTKASPAPRTREFLADVTLTVWLLDDLEAWQSRMRRPIWPLCLGRSQDLVGVCLSIVELIPRPGVQGQALVPDGEQADGALLRLPTAVSPGRDRTRWESYRFDHTGRSSATLSGSGHWSTQSGQAVVPLEGTHSDSAADMIGA